MLNNHLKFLEEFEEGKLVIEFAKTLSSSLAKLTNMIDTNEISSKQAKEVLELMLDGQDPEVIVKEKGMKQVFDEIIPTLDLPREELLAYAESVLERFANPYIKHYLSSIALNSVSKFKVRVLPSILEYEKRFSKLPEHLIFAFAKLIEFYRTDMTNDDEKICNFMKTASMK